jgi:hypothetical protein
LPFAFPAFVADHLQAVLVADFIPGHRETGNVPTAVLKTNLAAAVAFGLFGDILGRAMNAGGNAVLEKDSVVVQGRGRIGP